MKKTSLIIIAVLLVALMFTGCGKPEAAADSSSVAMAEKAPVSDGSEDLKVDYQLNIAGDDENNYFTFSGNIRYIEVEKDHVDAVTGASALGGKTLFQPYIYDVEGKRTFSGAVRGLFLYATNFYSTYTVDAVDVSKASDGVITIQYAHRGTAYRIVTDASGKLAFPDGVMQKRAIGYIASGAPQVISKDFSADGTAATIDWAKVWDSNVADGKAVDANSDKKTGPIYMDTSASGSMYYYDGTLDFALTGDILTVNGFLTAVSR